MQDPKQDPDPKKLFRIHKTDPRHSFYWYGEGHKVLPFWYSAKSTLTHTNIFRL
jgi:hypothetical protein